MKKIIYAFAGVLALLSFSSCSMFKYDVLDGPNAQINGRLVDVQTGEKIGIEYYSGSSAPGTLIVVEHGWDSEAEQGWLVRFDGMYTNNLIFAGEYSFFSKRLPCYQPENNTFTAKPGNQRRSHGSRQGQPSHQRRPLRQYPGVCRMQFPESGQE